MASDSWCVGIDPSSKRVVYGGINQNGGVRIYDTRIPPALRGAQRLRLIRAGAREALGWFGAVNVVVVEIPWASPKGGSSFVLMSIAGVLLEAAQATCSNAVAIDMPTQVWKKATVGNGNASKQECIDHAQGLGMKGSDSDEADALCMASAGWEAWGRRTEHEL